MNFFSSSNKQKYSKPTNKYTYDASFEVTAIVERLRGASLLLQEPAHQVTAHFNRDEIQVGGVLLGLGDFCVTYEVAQLPYYSSAPPTSSKVLPRTVGVGSGGDTATVTSRRSVASLSQSPEEDERRRICTANVENYSLKQLNPKFIKKHSKQRNANSRIYDVAAATLVLEAQYLSRLSHDHIIKLRGIPLGEEYVAHVHEEFFVLTDRIVETLTERMQAWKEQEEADQLAGLTIPALKLDTESPVFLEKMSIARGILSAVHYLQEEHKIVVLNLNPNTIGFNQHGVVVLFDLGHCREIVSEVATEVATEENDADTAEANNNSNGSGDNENSNNQGLSDDELSVDDLSVMLGSPVVANSPPAAGQTANSPTKMGSHRKVVPTVTMGVVPRYLAPELVTHGTYCLQSDSYSFALILFEMLTLSKPFAILKPGQHLIQVCIQGKRPNLTLYQFPAALDNLLKKGWKHNWNRRLTIATMNQVFSNASFQRSSRKSKQQRGGGGRRGRPPTETETRQPRRGKRPDRPGVERQRSVSLSPRGANNGSRPGLTSRRKSDRNIFSMMSPTARKKQTVQMTNAMRQKHQVTAGLLE